MTTEYVYQNSKSIMIANLDCTDLVPFSPCPATYAGPIDGLAVACDEAGYRIDARWTTNVESGKCTSDNPMVVLDGAMVGSTRCPMRLGGTGEVYTIETCVSVRDQESCARFEYQIP